MVQRVLITGITGFVGSHMADFILSKHPECEVWGTRRWHLSRMDHVIHIKHKIRWVDCNLSDPIGVRAMMDKVSPDIVFHFAAESFVSPSWAHPTHYMRINYDATVNLLDALHQAKSQAPFHIPGSGEEFGEISEAELPIRETTLINPVNPYAVSKIAQDFIGYVYYKSYGLNVIRTRAFNHEGPRRENVFGIPSYAYQIARIEAGLQPPLVRVGHMDDRRNFTHILDMVEAYWLACKHCQPGQLYLIGSDSEDSVYTFRQALEMLIGKSEIKGIGHQIEPEYVRPTNVPFLISDISKFRAATGWRTKLSFERILNDTLEYWRQRVRSGTA